MRKTKRTELTVETDEIVVLRTTGKAIQAWCPQCGEAVRMITSEEALVLASVNTRTIYRLVQDSKVHYAKTAEGFLRICLRSLSRHGIKERSDIG